MHAPEREDDALRTLHDDVAPERVTTPLGNKKCDATDVKLSSSSGRRPLTAVTLEQNDLLGDLRAMRTRSGAWPTVDAISDYTGTSPRPIRRMLASLTRVGLVAVGVRGEAIVVGDPGGVFHQITRASFELAAS